MQDILLVIDMQNDFIDGALGTGEAVAIVPKVKEKIESFPGTVIFTRDTHGEEYLETQEGRNLPVPHCIRGTDGWQIRPELDALRKTEAIDKVTFGSSALGEMLTAMNEEEKITSITLIGLCTDICVISNAMIAKAFLPEVPIIVDAACCAGVSVESHENALKAMEVCQIKVVNRGGTRKNMDEKIVVVSSDIMSRAYGVDSEKIIRADEAELLSLVHKNYELIFRSKVEQDNSYKQMISYCLITCGDEIFVTRRTKKQTESRLHNMYSVGVGGHISATDLGSEDVVIAGMLRELHEEVYIPSDVKYEFFGIINDNSSEVNSVHLGICYVIRLDEKDCSVRETEKMEGRWIGLDEIGEYLEHMEGWSKILLGSYLAEKRRL